MNIALVGFGLEGAAALKYWSAQGANITVCDQNSDLAIPDGVARKLGEGYLDDLDTFDLVWRTAGINPETILAKNPGIADKMTTTINEFLRVCPTKNVIGVTGTKGKGTTSTLTARMLEAAGKHVLLGGNIGLSPLDFLDQITPDTWVVLELSSFQLSDLQHSPHIAVCLMVVPEHLNWHKDMADYLRAKSQLFAHQIADDLAIYFADNENSRKIAEASPGHKIPFYQEPGAHIVGNQIMINDQAICQTDELKLLGKHNWQNVCAAATAVWQVAQDIAAIRSVATSFTGLEHRIEFVREKDGIRYYNDSYAATPDAAIAAIEAIPEMKVVIMGGFDRQLPIQHLARALNEHRGDIRKVVIIGASGPRFVSELQAVGFDNYELTDAKTMPEVVAKAKGYALNGDAVLLSPGFASFDMFKNFEDRGQQYKQVAQSL